MSADRQLPPGHILVVDDQPDNRDMLARRLGRLGYVVETAASGQQALDIALPEPPDLVVLDYMMPGMTGLDVLEALRRHYDEAMLPVIIVTAQTDDETVVACLDRGANDFVPKPIAFAVLRARIRAQLERRRSALALNWVNHDLERRVAERTAELARQNEVLSLALSESEAAARAKSQFLASVSHELRTPLNAVIGLSELLHKEVLGPLEPPRYREFVGEILRSGHYLLEIVSGVLDATRVEKDMARLDLARLELAALVADCVSMVRRASDRTGTGRGAEFSTRLAEVWLVGDRHKLHQALTNILPNAAKFSEPDKPIVVSCWREGDFAVVEVLDNGPGIPPGQEETALQPFVQLLGPRDVKPEGVGLGLHIANLIVKAHGGRLDLANRESTGLAVRIVLPVNEMPVDKNGEA